MGEETAKIVLQIEDAEEVLNILRQLREFTDSFSGGGGGSPGATGAGPQPGGVRMAGAQMATPPPGPGAPQNGFAAQMGMNPGMMPSTFATWDYSRNVSVPLAYDPSRGMFMNANTGMGMAGVGWPGAGGGAGPGGAPDPKQPGIMASAFAAVGGMQAVNSLLGTGASAAGMYGTASALGRPFYSESLQPALVGVSAMVAGAAIGTMVAPGIGTAIGAGVGASVGGIDEAYARPLIEQGIKAKELGYLMADTGYNFNPSMMSNPKAAIPQDVLDLWSSDITSGREMDAGIYDQAMGMSHLTRGAFLKGVNRALYSPNNVGRYGSGFKGVSAKDALIGDAYGNELETKVALGQLMNPAEANQLMDDLYVARIQSEGEMMVSGARVGLDTTRYGLAARYGGSAAAKEQMGGVQGSMRESAAATRAVARLKMAAGNTYEAQVLNMQAEQMDLQANAVPEVYLSALGAENSAYSSLETGRANRDFERSLYSGASAAALPWDKKSGALNNAANRLEAERSERRRLALLSPAEDARYQEQIESLRYQASEGVGREREGMINRERVAETSLSVARTMNRETPGILTSSAVESAGKQYDTQLSVLKEQADTLQRILETSRYLTHEQKLQLETQITNLKTEEERVKIAAVAAKAGAAYMTVETASIETSSGARIRMIEGAGGRDASLAMQKDLGATDRSIAAKKAQIAELMTTFDANSEEVQNARRQLAGMEVGRAAQVRSMAIVPMSSDERIARSNLDVTGAFVQAGYGSFGDVRELSLAQINARKRRIDELNQGKQDFIKANGAGAWTPAMEADLTETRNAQLMEGLGFAQQYNEGWDQRLISAAYNMPGNGRLLMSRFTHREAAAAGVMHRAFGGSEEQTRAMREMYPRFMRAMGSGNPGNFLERAMGGEERRVGVDVKILIQDPRGLVAGTAVQLANHKTAADGNVNASASKVPSG